MEFALVAVAFYLLLAGTLELGRMVTASQMLQNAARTAARELALVPLPATYTFDQALQCSAVQKQVYDETLLVVPFSGTMPDTSTWPIVNRMLVPLMVVTRHSSGDVLQYPGAIIQVNGGRTVAVPVVKHDDSGETITWVPVLEEVRPDGPPPAPGTPPGSFSLVGIGGDRGVVAVRLNYPYQATTMVALRDAGTHLEPVRADDGAVDASGGPPGNPTGGANGAGAYTGQYALGKFYAFGEEVRPYRRLISAQSVFRREVFGPANICGG